MACILFNYFTCLTHFWRVPNMIYVRVFRVPHKCIGSIKSRTGIYNFTIRHIWFVRSLPPVIRSALPIALGRAFSLFSFFFLFFLYLFGFSANQFEREWRAVAVGTSNASIIHNNVSAEQCALIWPGRADYNTPKLCVIKLWCALQ